MWVCLGGGAPLATCTLPVGMLNLGGCSRRAPAHYSSLPTAYNAGVPCFAPSKGEHIKEEGLTPKVESALVASLVECNGRKQAEGTIGKTHTARIHVHILERRTHKLTILREEDGAPFEVDAAADHVGLGGAVPKRLGEHLALYHLGICRRVEDNRWAANLIIPPLGAVI